MQRLYVAVGLDADCKIFLLHVTLRTFTLLCVLYYAPSTLHTFYITRSARFMRDALRLIALRSVAHMACLLLHVWGIWRLSLR